MIDPTNFSWRTRKQRQEFDSIKQAVLTQTPEEIAAEEEEEIATRLKIVSDKLATIWMSVPQNLTKTRVVTFMNNINAKQWVWGDIQKYLQWQLELHWSYKKVIEYLVLTYL